ncbi:energy transducer TonB [Psychroserpens sp. XS_ASV72]|uniref:energy transducer TonB n=1 Tax=Psychroserpens sp. XS_ASV72 TaxID=3241293 RepID=UPI003516C1CE
MLHYILQVVAFQLVFMLFYDGFLRKETFFNLNRAYLIITAHLSVFIPFVKLEQIKSIVPDDFVIQLPQVIIGDVSQSKSLSSDIIELAGIPVEEPMVPIWNVILISGIIVATLFFVFKIFKLIKLVYKNPRQWSSDILIIKLLNSSSAFSFFHYVFLGDKLSSENRKSILQHEMVHVKQKHSIDLMLFELLRIVFWFNPLVYIYQNRISELHEFIADSKVVKYQDKTEFYNQLLLQVFDTKQVSFVNPFFKQSLIKKRILMLSKSKSKQIHILKYVLLLPIISIMLIYTASYAQDPSSIKKDVPSEVINNETNENILRQKYLNELIEKENSGASFAELSRFLRNDDQKYILSRDEYLRLEVFLQYMMNSKRDRVLKNGDTISTKILPKNKQLFKDYRSYEDYLVWKQTDEAKETWENNIKDGILRLIVEDAANMTEEEKQKMRHKLDMVERDAYFKGLLVVSMDGSTKMVMHSPKSNVVSESQKTAEVDTEVEVPFAIIEQAPIYEGCQDLSTNEARKQCFIESISKHVADNFNTDIAKVLGLQGKQRISVLFKIDKKGNVTQVKARAPHPDLEEEAIRVIELLPQFKPGTQKGKRVVVPYSLPILFQVEQDSEPETSVKATNKTISETVQDKNSELTEVPFAVVDKAPVFFTCKDLVSEQERRSCTDKEVAILVNKNFNLDLPKKLGLTGSQQIFAAFKIYKDGSVKDIKVRAPHPKLEEETKRVLNLLPKFIPGEQNGKPTIVAYSLPIRFKIAD